jgi:type II secretory pathway pseudopilin PulG
MRRRQQGERGFTLLAVIVAVTLLLIALAAAAPRMSTAIKRDREEELVHRAHQYTRAIQLFYRKFGRFPNSVDELENTNNVRFLRRRYPDPITGKEEWRLIRLGQAKPKKLPAWQTGGSSKTGAGTTPAAAMGGQGSGIPGTGTSPTGASGTGTSGSGAQGDTGDTSKTGSGIVNAEDISKPLTGSSNLGVGAIVGVSSTSEKTGLKIFNDKHKYNEWEFVYDPTEDPYLRGFQQGGGQNLSSPSGASPTGPKGPGGTQPTSNPQPQQPQPMAPGGTTPK